MAISIQEVEQFLYREARMLDDRDFEGRLNCYAPDAVSIALDDEAAIGFLPGQYVNIAVRGRGRRAPIPLARGPGAQRCLSCSVTLRPARCPRSCAGPLK